MSTWAQRRAFVRASMSFSAAQMLCLHPAEVEGWEDYQPTGPEMEAARILLDRFPLALGPTDVELEAAGQITMLATSEDS